MRMSCRCSFTYESGSLDQGENVSAFQDVRYHSGRTKRGQQEEIRAGAQLWESRSLQGAELRAAQSQMRAWIWQLGVL